tara:strand:+ start:185 stop:784 length:600 start_codon:yes stop_codon:yes gene_type:complete
MKKGIMAIVIFLTFNVFGEFSSNFSFSSNYFWRGMTQTMDAPGYSGGFDYSSESGFYAGTWGSNVAFGGAGLELDTYLGYAGEMKGGFGYDIGYINYAYPEITPSADFSETYIGLSYSGLGFTYFVGDEFGDYFNFSYGFGNFLVSFGDYEDTGSSFLVGYDLAFSGYDVSINYSSFAAKDASGLEDEDGLFFTVGANF